MARKHGVDTVILVGAVDISEHCNASEISESGDAHDITGYKTPQNRRKFDIGLASATFTMGGWYDNDETTGPRNVLLGKVGTKLQITRQPEGTGSGLPQDVFTVVVTGYNESDPVDNYITWGFSGTIDGPIDSTPQT